MNAMKRPVFYLLVLLATCSPGARAFGETTESILKAALARGELDQDKYVRMRLDSIFRPQTLPNNYRGNDAGEFYCLTPHLMELWGRRASLNRETQDLLNVPFLRPTDPAYAPGNTDTSYTVSEATPFDTTHFRIHYVTSTADAPNLTDLNANGVPDFVESAGALFEAAYNAEVAPGVLGFLSPVSDGTLGGDSRTDVYLKEIFARLEALGYTPHDPETFVKDNGGSGFVVVDNNFSDDEVLNGIRVLTPNELLATTAAHELFHVLQYAYCTVLPEFGQGVMTFLRPTACGTGPETAS